MKKLLLTSGMGPLPGMGGRGGAPPQVHQQLANLTPEQRQQFQQLMSLSPEQVSRMCMHSDMCTQSTHKHNYALRYVYAKHTQTQSLTAA
jgi:Spy/CpxP family protein refolding chaperone